MRAIIVRQEQFIVDSTDPVKLWEVLFEALYCAEATAERLAQPDLLKTSLAAKSAAVALWKASPEAAEAA